MTLTEGSVAPPLVGELCVLLVEDDDGDAFMVEELLREGSGFDAGAARFVRARTVAQAVDFFRAGDTGSRVDCVLLDLGLPDSSGLDGLRRLLDVVPRCPVVVLTGHTDASHGVAAVAAGAQDYAVKGQVNGSSLMRVLRYAIERRRAQIATAELQIARLREQENRRLERGLLPTPLLSDPAIVFAARYEPGQQQLLLGGDFYDAVEAPDSTLHVLIGDVAGHGVEEAAMGVMLRIAWRTLIVSGAAVDSVLSTLQRMLVSERRQRYLFATVGIATISPDRDEVRYWLAGHPPPLLVSESGARLLPSHALGFPLGVDDTARWSAHTAVLPRMWSLLLCTDGLFEGGGEVEDEQLWLDGLLRLVEKLSADRGGLTRWHHDPRDFLDVLVSHVKALDPGHTDDLASVLICGTRASDPVMPVSA